MAICPLQPSKVSTQFPLYQMYLFHIILLCFLLQILSTNMANGTEEQLCHDLDATLP